MIDEMAEREMPGPAYTDAVQYGRHTIVFDVIRTARETLGIHVYPSGRVEVRVPLAAEADEIRARVQRRARWVLRHQRRFAELVQVQPRKDYVNGETHCYLGRQYRLRVRPLDAGGLNGPEEGVKLVGRFFEVYTTRPDHPEHTRKLLERWYRQKADHHLRQRFAWGCAQMARYGIEPPQLAIRRMERRWGSCTPSGRILLNPRLILAPMACIDYVVVHELCHLKHPYHSRAFYDLLGRVMPDWEQRKTRLERVQ